MELKQDITALQSLQTQGASLIQDRLRELGYSTDLVIICCDPGLLQAAVPPSVMINEAAHEAPSTIQSTL